MPWSVAADATLDMGAAVADAKTALDTALIKEAAARSTLARREAALDSLQQVRLKSLGSFTLSQLERFDDQLDRAEEAYEGA